MVESALLWRFGHARAAQPLRLHVPLLQKVAQGGSAKPSEAFPGALHLEPTGSKEDEGLVVGFLVDNGQPLIGIVNARTLAPLCVVAVPECNAVGLHTAFPPGVYLWSFSIFSLCFAALSSRLWAAVSWNAFFKLLK